MNATLKTILICALMSIMLIGGALGINSCRNRRAPVAVVNNPPAGQSGPVSVTIPNGAIAMQMPNGPIPVVLQGPITLQWPAIPDGGIPVAVQNLPPIAVGSLPPLPPVVINVPTPPVPNVADSGNETSADASTDASATDAATDTSVTVIATTVDAGAPPPVDNGQVAVAAGPTPALVPPPGMTCAAAAADAGTPACTAVPSREVTFYNGRTLPFQLHAGWNCDATRPLAEPLRDGPNGYTANVCAAGCIFCR